MRKFCVVFVLFLLLPVFSFSVYTKSYEVNFHITNAQDFFTLSNVSFFQDGSGLSLSLPIVSLYSGIESFVSSALYSDGNIIFSTVNPNNVYVLTTNGVQLIGAFPDHSIITKIKKIDGNVFVLTGGRGAIYFFGKSGETKKILDVDGYVWDVFKIGDNYFAITGNPARIYKFSLAGVFEVVFENANEKHFLSVSVLDKFAYIGSSGTGTIYRFDGKEVKSFVSLPEGEITSIKVYSGDLIVSTYDILQQKVQQSPQQSAQQEQKQMVQPYTFSSIGKIYRISPSGIKRVLVVQNGISDFEIVSNYILAVTTDGKLVQFSIDNEKLVKISFYGDNFIKVMDTGRSNLIILTGSPAGMRIISNTFDNYVVGTVETKEISFGDVQAFGRISFDSMLPEGSKIKAFVKGGNSPVEDNTWSQWVEIRDGDNLSSKGISNFSFLKLKIVMSSRYVDSLVLRNVKIFYTPNNSEPVFRSFSYSIKDEFINLEWDCNDPDGDNLIFDVFVKDYKSTEWQKLNSSVISEQRFSVSRYLVGNGYFDFKVVASDELTNPKGFAKTNFSVIKNVMIDIKPPSIDSSSIKVNKSTNSVQVVFRVVDNILIREVRYSTDGQNWYYVLPEDGVIDSPVESFKLELPRDARVLIIRIRDGQGNISVERIDL